MEREGCVTDSAGSIEKKNKTLQLVSKHRRIMTRIRHWVTELTKDLNCK